MKKVLAAILVLLSTSATADFTSRSVNGITFTMFSDTYFHGPVSKTNETIVRLVLLEIVYPTGDVAKDWLVVKDETCKNGSGTYFIGSWNGENRSEQFFHASGISMGDVQISWLCNQL